MGRILMLHGFSQNAAIFSKRMGAIRKACGKDVEFVFIDGPLILEPADLDTSTSSLGAQEASTEESDPALIPRAWWKFNADRSAMRGAAGSLAMLRDLLRSERFDGVFGFSQGAAMAALLSAVLERPHLHPPFLIDGESPHPPFKFCVAVSGFLVLDPIAQPFYTPSYTTQTLHVIGLNDVIVNNERSKGLIDASSNKRIELHDGGHFVPSKASWRNFFRDFLRDPFGDVPSPSSAFAGSGSEPASGAATPVEGTHTPMMKL